MEIPLQYKTSDCLLLCVVHLINLNLHYITVHILSNDPLAVELWISVTSCKNVKVISVSQKYTIILLSN